jgi:hypothetical protein
MELFKSDFRTITLERYSIEREASGQPATIRAQLLVSGPSTGTPSSLRVRVKYQVPEMPIPANERDFGRRLLQLLGNQLDTR